MVATTYYDVLYELLAFAPSIVIRRGSTPPGDLGIVQHANNIVTISRSASASVFASALIQATIDLHRGSALAPDRAEEAKRVRDQAARVAVHPVLAAFDHPPDPERLARALGVDVATVLLGIQLAAAEGAGPTMR